MKLVGGGSFINAAYPVLLLNNKDIAIVALQLIYCLYPPIYNPPHTKAVITVPTVHFVNPLEFEIFKKGKHLLKFKLFISAAF